MGGHLLIETLSKNSLRKTGPAVVSSCKYSILLAYQQHIFSLISKPFGIFYFLQWQPRREPEAQQRGQQPRVAGQSGSKTRGHQAHQDDAHHLSLLLGTSRGFQSLWHWPVCLFELREVGLRGAC